MYTDKRVITGFSIALFILLVLGYFSYQNNKRFINTREWVFHTSTVLYHLEQTLANAIRTDEILAVYVISGDTTLLKAYAEELQKAAGHYTYLRELTADNMEQQVLMDSFRDIGTRKLKIHQQIIMAMPVDKEVAESIIISQENSDSSFEVDSIISSMINLENQLLMERIALSKASIENFQNTFLGLMGVIVSILIGVFLLINTSFKARLIAEEKTKEINQELESFTYSVSHDLRAPLRSIRGFTEVLSDEYGPQIDQEGNRLLKIVMKNASRMGQLIDDLLDFSRLGRKDLSYSKINVDVILSEVIQELTEHDKRNVSWNIKPLEDMRGDVNMIKQVWVNLISNALKYTRNKAEAQIEIGSYPLQGNVIYYVKDNGVGFDMKYSGKLFNVFQRLHNSSEFEGTGVGLALAYRIISRHNGKIWADAKVERGSTFSFYINSLTT